MNKKFIWGILVAGFLASNALAGQPVTIQNSANTAAAGVTGTSLNVACTSGCTGSGGSPSIVTGSVSNASSGVATTSTNVPTVSYNYGWNGTTWDQLTTVPAVPTTGKGLLGAGIAAGYNTTLPTYTNGQYGILQSDVSGNLRSYVVAVAVTGSDGFSNSGLSSPSGSGELANPRMLTSAQYSFNATGWDRSRNIIGAVLAGTGNSAVDIAPTSAAPAAIVPAISASSATTSLVAKASPGNYYDAYCQSTAAGRCIIYNATSAPGAGALTAALVLECAVVAAGGQGSIQYGDIPRRASVGIVVLFSSATDCNTYTASSTAYIHASAQ